MSLVVATNNAGKLREFRALLAGVEVASPAELGFELDVEESGETFAANAELKASAYAAASGRIALADDSGLEVDALNGAPGVYSARYGGPGLDDAGRCLHLLESLRPFPDPTQRHARFRCIVCAIAPDGRSCQAEGTCEGLIAQAPAGSNGFGYDPVFFVPDHNATMAQLAPQIKNGLSHRARALEALRPLLASTFPELKTAPSQTAQP
jgi:XTP/dITP diphosphohydrolase